ncbi:MAG: hypothetical protein RBS17_04935 [Coriobacteriia bacterium]|nr:hypothetical protein [Coriobacteriia bacterium]
MNEHTEILRVLSSELYAREDADILHSLASASTFEYAALAAFDTRVGGPSVAALVDRRRRGGTLGIPQHGVGRYEIADRDVFRPLQYAGVYFTMNATEIEWLTRAIVEASSGHVEALVKRIGRTPRSPLGAALRALRGRNVMDPETEDLVGRFVPIYNDAKHAFDHDMDTHRFSVEDAVLAYFVCRRLGERLYSLARLNTDMSVFDLPV